MVGGRKMSVQNPGLAAEANLPEESKPQTRHTSTFSRLAKYTVYKLSMLFVTVLIAVYLTILIANMGGYVDEIVRGTIREFVGNALRGNREYQQMAPSEKNGFFASEIARVEKRYGLDQPFVVRSFNYLWNAVRLDFGNAQLMASDTGSRQVNRIILDRLAPTLLLLGTANLFLFFTSVALALSLSRSYRTCWGKIVFALLVITLWQGLILTEGVFQWPGLGRTYITAIGLYDTSVIVALTIIYAYLLAITVFILDFVYALVDPRVKIGSI